MYKHISSNPQLHRNRKGETAKSKKQNTNNYNTSPAIATATVTITNSINCVSFFITLHFFSKENKKNNTT